jgi:hypothetical protein
MARISTEIKSNNLAINGSFNVWQRGTSFSGMAQYNYTADRWAITSAANTSATITRQSAATTENFAYLLRWTAGSTSSSFNIAQALEEAAVNPLKGRKVTFSAYMRVNSGNVRTYQLQVFKNATPEVLTTGTWTLIDQSTAGVLTTTWQRISVTCTIPADGSTRGLKLGITDLATGLAADYVEVSRVMFSDSAVPVEFTLAGQNIEGELALCMRYFETIGSGDYTELGGGLSVSTTSAQGTALFKVPKRVTPTTTVSSQIGFRYNNAANNFQSTAVTLASNSVYSVNLVLTVVGVSAGNVPGLIDIIAGNYLYATAELV